MLLTRSSDSIFDFESSPETHINFTVDWLSFTCRSSRPDPLDDQCIRSIIERVYPNPSDVFVDGKGRYSYLHAWVCTGCMILYDPSHSATQDQSSVHIIFDGTGLRLARTVLGDSFDDWITDIQSWFKLVRCDLALDVFDCPHWDKIIQKIDDHDYVSSWRSFSVIRSDHDGYTATFGKRGQNYYCRIYNKLAEQAAKHLLPSDFSCKSWFRIELELRDCDFALRSYAPLHQECSLSSRVLLRFFADAMRQRIRFNGVPTYFFFVSQPILSEPALDEYVDPINKSIAWVEHQVVPTLDRLVKLFGRPFIDWILGYNRNTLLKHSNPKVGDHLAQYFSWYCPDVLAPKLLR